MRATALLFLLTACQPRFHYYGDGTVKLDSGDTEPVVDSEDSPGPDDSPVDTDPVDPVETGDTHDTVDTAPPVDDGYWNGVSLTITAPSSGDFLPYGEDTHFEAVLTDAEGEDVDFDEVVWTSDADSSWSPEGRSFDDDSLDVGTHNLTARAELPNGDRLATTIGGLLVQSWYSGTYSGTITTNATISYGGVDYPITASGGASLVVDATGELVVGTADCVLAIGTWYELSLSFLIEATNDDGEVEGTAAVDLGWFAYDMAMTGTVTEDGVLTLAFSDELMSIPIEGTIDAVRVSYETEFEESALW